MSDRATVAVRPYGWLLVAAFAVTTTAGYGVLGYSFAVFLVPMQQALHAGPAEVTLAQTLSILTTAAVTVPAGRWLDRHGVVMIGLGFGVVTIGRPALIADRYGTIVFATLAGLQASVLMIGKAFAPLGAAAVRSAAGTYHPVLWGCAACFVLAAVALVVAGRLRRAPVSGNE